MSEGKHPGGRPNKFTKEILEASGGILELEDTYEIQLPIKNIKNVLANKTFESEKELSLYIDYHIEDFTRDILKETLVSYEKEYIILKNGHHIKNTSIFPIKKRIDFYIETEKYEYLIELKNPTSLTSNRNAIGQVLDYGRFFDSKKRKLMIVTTKYDLDTAQIISEYNLPIRYIYLDKGGYVEYTRS